MRRIAAAAISVSFLVTTTSAAQAAACAFEAQDEGRVAEIVDGRSLRLSDGREIRLAGIESVAAEDKAALSALARDKDVSLHGPDDTPDRYGRQTAFVFLAGSDISLQAQLLTQGAALASTDVTDKDCAAALLAAEAEARAAKKGGWANPNVIKNAESAADILAGIGRFVLVEGRVLSVRQAGTMTYLNFGRNWTRDFAATISRRMMPGVESSGLTLKSLENRRIRVRGWVEAHPGPRIEVVRAGQIEVLSGK
jgi:endonuclease YncB( thermonuclease family)